MMNLQAHVYIPPLWLAATLVASSFAQIAQIAPTSPVFTWSFVNPNVAITLPSCKPMPISVTAADSTDTTGTPPYYLMVFAPNAIPMTTFIGTDPKNLNWNVSLPSGSEMALAVVDSLGNFGGSQPIVWTVNTGELSSCIPPPDTSPPFTVTSNVTESLESCQPWGLTMRGGVPPYTVTILQLNPSIAVNITMPVETDRFTYVNNISPSTTLIAAVSDSTGRWANGTPFLNTPNAAGLTDGAQCIDTSSSGNNTLIQQAIDSTQASAAAAKAKRSLVIELSVTVLIFIAIGLGIWIFIYLHRWQLRRRSLLSSTTPQFTGGQVLSDDDIESARESAGRPPAVRERLTLGLPPAYHRDAPPPSENVSPDDTTHLSRDLGVSINSDEATIGNPVPQYTVSRGIHTRGFANFPSSSTRSSTRRSAKAVEAGMSSATSSPDSEYAPESAISDGSNSVGSRISPMSEEAGGRQQAPAPTDSRIDEAVPRDLPPPYVD